MKSNRHFAAFFLCAVFIPAFFLSASAFTIHLEGTDSPYSQRLRAYFLKTGPVRAAAADPKIVCLTTPNDPLYIGVEQTFVIHAPVSRVTALLDDFSHYPGLFEDVVKASVIRSSGPGSFVLRQEQKIPVPFMSNLVYDMAYFSSAGTSGKRYLYKLCGGKDMRYNDGMIVVTDLGNNECSFYELDFIYGNWSALGKLSNSIIWESVVKGAVGANLTIRMKAEHPDWTFKAASKEARKINGTIWYSGILKNKVPAQTLL